MSALAEIPVRRIVGAIADAAERWSDADFPARVRLLDRIAERTGYTIPVVEFALDQLFSSITRNALEATIANELGSLDVLDGFAPRIGRPRGFARPIGAVAVLSSRTTIGVAIAPAVFALCAKCDVLVKDRDDGLVAAFFRTLHEELDALGTSARAQSSDGESDDVDLAHFDAVVAFGNDENIARIRELTAPGAPFIAYGSKASIGYAGRDALTHATLRDFVDGAARDLVLYETEGCLSLHALFIERGGAIEPGDVARAIASAVERAAVEFPPGERDASANSGIVNTRNLAAFRAAGGSGSVFSDAGASYLAVLDPPAVEAPSFLPRTLAIHTVDRPSDALDFVRRHRLPIEAVAVAGTREDIVSMAVAMGANRITHFGELQRPTLTGAHGGRARVADFIRWTTSDV